MEFSQEIKDLLKEEFPNKDIYSMSLDELKAFRIKVTELRQEYSLLELAFKTLGNAAYGSAANNFFYFYNLNLAGDITGECRELTQFMWNRLELFFHEDIWQRKELWKQFDFELDESKHDWYRQQPTSVYSDTDSVYTTYGTLFDCMTLEYQKKYDTDRKRIDWILKFNKEFLDKQNNKWLDELYNPRHAKNIHEFELETISTAAIYLKKKKYLKGLSYSKGKFYDKPKMSGTGIEIIKSTTPKLCRKILTELMEDLMFKAGTMSKEDYIFYFRDKLGAYKKQFYAAPIEDISQSVGIGAYGKYIIEDEENFVFDKGCPLSVKAIGLYNHLAYKNGQKNLRMVSGKIKYYNIRISPKETSYFGFPAGELPTWAPKMDKTLQWQKTVIDPINRFLEVMKLPLMNSENTLQMNLFGFD
ncbi:MAG: hypothetical protein J6D03_00575 [Clostridia bacterium]|nr:hypothetical protein [Clostridia bacterium]